MDGVMDGVMMVDMIGPFLALVGRVDDIYNDNYLKM